MRSRPFSWAVHAAYGNKKERARAASAKSRASNRGTRDVAYCGDIEDAVVACVTNVSVCDVAVDCVAEAVPEAAPEVVAAPTPAVAAKKKNTRADNVAVEPAPVAAVPAVAPTQRQARVVEAAPRRGLCAMVASASV